MLTYIQECKCRHININFLKRSFSLLGILSNVDIPSTENMNRVGNKQVCAFGTDLERSHLRESLRKFSAESRQLLIEVFGKASQVKLISISIVIVTP